MPLGTPSPSAVEDNLPVESSGPAGRPLALMAGFEIDPTIGFLHQCIEAMSLLQARFVGLEVEAQIKLDAAGREIGEVFAALSETQGALERADQRLRESEDRITRLETIAVETARRHADDMATIRAEASTTRMRGDTDMMAFEHLTARLAKIEDELTVRLDRATQDLDDRNTENAFLRTHVEAAQVKTDRLETKLRDADAILAEQRSRISCLQSKLATATYALRMDQMTRQFESALPPSERDILDLRGLSKDIISAA